MAVEPAAVPVGPAVGAAHRRVFDGAVPAVAHAEPAVRQPDGALALVHAAVALAAQLADVVVRLVVAAAHRIVILLAGTPANSLVLSLQWRQLNAGTGVVFTS